MKRNALLDTNVLMYAVQDDSDFYERSQAVLNDSSLNLFTTSKNLVEFVVAITKGEQPLATVNEALDMIEAFEDQLHVLYPNLASLMEFERLVSIYQIKGLRVHDVEIAAIGLANGVSTIATFNTDDFKNIGEITLLTP